MKTKVLVFVRFYLPGYKSGGPLRTIANLVDHLGDDCLFRIVTSDRDATDNKPYPGIRLDAWNTLGKSEVFYASPKNRSLGAVARLMRETPHDLIYLNSFFDPHYSMKPLVARRLGLAPRRPCVIAPRGEFSKGALALKAWKKKPSILAAQGLRLHSNVTWQASSECEVAAIRRVMGDAASDIAVASDLPPNSEAKAGEIILAERVPEAPLRVCFLSRITPMKNLDFALRVLAEVRTPVHFEVYGPVRDEAYWAECKALMEVLPSHVSAHYAGSVDHNRVSAVIGAHDLFFLPTRGENYGHVILEALLSATPVLISDTTPWRDLAKSGVGWDLPLNDEQAFARRIDEIAALPPDKHSAMRRRAHSFAVEKIHDVASVEANRALFLRAGRSSLVCPS